MAESVIFDIKIPTDEVDKAIQEISKMRQRVEELRDANKGLDKSSEAYAKNAVEIKRLSADIRTNERVLVANTKAQKANEGSIEQLRAQLSKTTTEWTKLSKEERENTSEGQALTQQKKDLTEELKRLEKATGDNRRNVGNYSESMREALKESGLFSREQQALATAQKAVKAATAGATGATKLFRAALISTGIGALVVAMGTLVTYLTQTQKGMDLVNQVMEGAKAIFQVLIDRVLTFGEGLYDIFVKQDFRKGIDKLKTSVKGLGQEIVEESKAAAGLEKQLQSIIKAEADLNVERAKSRAEIEQLKFLAEDQSKSTQERADAAAKALGMEQELLDRTIKLQQERLEILKAQNELGTSTEADLQRVRDAEIELANLQAESTTKQIELNNKLNALRKEGAKIVDEETEAVEKQVESISDNIEKITDKYLLEQKRQLIEGVINREQYNQRIIEKELELLELQKAARTAAGLDTIELDNQIADIQIANIKKVSDAKKKEGEVAEEIKKAEGDTAAGVAQGVTDVVKQAAGENTAIAKAASLVNTGINIAEGITKAIASGGPVIGSILSGIVTAIGAVQQAFIRRQPTNFAEGVIGLDGPGSETSDSIPANLSRGESVMTAKATKVFAPQLAQMEQMVGNKPNFQLGNLKFAKGIIGIDNTTGLTQARSLTKSSDRTVELMDERPVFVSLTELEREQNKTNNQRSYAKFIE